MKNIVVTVVTAVLVLLAGCGQSLVRPDAALVSSRVASLERSVVDADRDARLARSAYLAAGDLRDGFAGYVCAGDGQYAAQRSALSALASIGRAYSAAYAAPSGDLDTLASNLSGQDVDVPMTAEPPDAVAARSRRSCMDRVNADLVVAPGPVALETRSIVAIGAAYTAAIAVWDAARKLVVVVLQEADAARREQAFFAFVRNDTEVAQVLGPCADDSRGTPGAEQTRACVATDTTSPLSAPQVAGIVRQKRVAALARPVARWMQLKDAADCDAPSTTCRLRDFLIAQPALDADLADYDALRHRAVPVDAELALVTGWLDMRRIARGDTTSRERREEFEAGVLKFVAGAKAIGASITSLGKAFDKATD